MALNIVFMGTPEFAVGVLSEIIKTDHKVVAVVTAPDRPAGRGRKLQASAVKEFAVEKNIAVLQPTNLKDEAFLFELESLKADIFVVVAFRMLPKAVWQMPKKGTFNLHASLLPDYRGAAPINWAIINGEKITGATTFFIDEKIDTGEIILQEQCNIEKDENAGDLHDRLMEMGGKLVVATLDLIDSGEVNTSLQPFVAQEKSAPKLTKENTMINFDKPAQEVIQLVQGLSPYPGAWFNLQNGDDQIMCKIYEASISTNEMTKIEIGKIFIEDKKIFIGTLDQNLAIESLQVSGKRKMNAQELLNGYKFQENARAFTV